jgi:uncharacterized damage-inducible protein DinB
MIHTIESYIQYSDGIRRRTLTFARAIPADRVDWSPDASGFTFGDILRHIAAVEKITIHAVAHNRWQTYPGHGPGHAASLDEIMAYLEETHAETKGLLGTLPDAALDQPRESLEKRPIKAWRLLMSIIEHEVHHRSQIASYLAALGQTPPQIYGLQVDDVASMSARLAEEGVDGE